MAERFYWRNCRSLGFRFRFWIWPWVFGVNRDEDLYGGERSLFLGPLEFGVSYSIGNSSAKHWWERLGGMSEAEAAERAGFSEETWPERPHD